MNLENSILTRHREGFSPGYTAITRAGETDPEGGFDTGIDFGIYRQVEGEIIEEAHPKESVWVLMKGKVEVFLNGQTHIIERQSIFDDPPTALHIQPNPPTPVRLKPLSAGVEWAVARTTNDGTVQSRLYTPRDLEPEYRGDGLVQGACLRNVRLIFDYETRKDSNLVVGEVVNYPGKWSSYPPHHHPQPEIYHYRFTKPQGYGHAELGDRVFKVKQNDTVLISDGLDHAQVSAPGYGMYYLWIIRHLPGNPYTGFTFTEDHQWTLNPENQGWEPKDGKGVAP